jgi:hypothetical protein
VNAQETFLRKTIPFFINSFNQHYYLRDFVDSLLKNGFCNIWILDNKSTFQPLIDYYKEIEKLSSNKVNILYYNENKGPHYFYLSEIYKNFWPYPHIYSDPDLLVPNMNEYFCSELLNISNKYSIAKVGCALAIPPPDLLSPLLRPMPETGNIPVSISDWEKQFWTKQLEQDIYNAPIDTTLHLFNPAFYIRENFYQAIRVAKNGFIAKHRPWYIDDQQPDDENEYYRITRSGHGGWVK